MTRWAALELEIPAGLEDDLVGWLGGASLGAESLPGPGERSVLRVYFASEEAAVAARERLRERLAGEASGPRAVSARVVPVADAMWAERYAASLGPFAVGRRFVVVPGALPPHPGGREPIRIVPGAAFGTGEHPTTRLAIEALERRVVPGDRWLDVGTGTGILAIVAVRCGAGSVAACDTDPTAVEVARETLAANGLAGAVALRAGPASLFAGSGFDGVVANLGARELCEEAAHLAAALRPGGLLLATGFLETQRKGVERELAARGLRPARRSEAGDWALVEAERTEP